MTVWEFLELSSTRIVHNTLKCQDVSGIASLTVEPMGFVFLFLFGGYCDPASSSLLESKHHEGVFTLQPPNCI